MLECRIENDGSPHKTPQIPKKRFTDDSYEFSGRSHIASRVTPLAAANPLCTLVRLHHTEGFDYGYTLKHCCTHYLFGCFQQKSLRKNKVLTQFWWDTTTSRPTRPSKKPATGLISGRGGWVNPNCVMQQPCTCMPTAGHKTYTKALLHALSFWLLPAEISEKEQGAHPILVRHHHLQANKAIQETSHRPDLTPLPCAPIWRSGQGETGS